MGLTDASFLWLLVGLSVVATAATVAGWRRLAGSGPLPVLGRIGAVVVTNLLVLLTVGAWFNDSYLFYATWADPFGSLQTTPTSSAGAAVGHSSVLGASHRDPLTGPGATSLPPDPASRALAATYTVTGSASGITAPVLVLLPTGYFARTNATRRYPVVEGFPAYPGTINGVTADFSVRDVQATLVAQHRVGPAIWVVPTVEVPAGTDTECVNGPRGTTQAETWVTHDVPLWLQRHYRVEPGAQSWATFGMSAGGWCAAMTAFLHPGEYGAAIVLGGYFAPQWSNWVPYPTGSAAYRRYDLVALAGRKPPAISLFVYTSQQDPESYPTTSAVLAAARPPLSVTALVANGGGHLLANWTPVFPKALSWLGTHLTGFRPVG